jgi:hypothetical protein
MEPAAILERIVIPEGKTIFRAGEPGDRAFVIQSGIVDIVRHVDRNPSPRPIEGARRHLFGVAGAEALARRHRSALRPSPPRDEKFPRRRRVRVGGNGFRSEPLCRPHGSTGRRLTPHNGVRQAGLTL